MMFLMLMVKIKPTIHLTKIMIRSPNKITFIFNTKSEVDHVIARGILAKEILPEEVLVQAADLIYEF